MNDVDILVVTALPLEYEAAKTVAARCDPGCPGVVWATAEEPTEPPYLRGTWLTSTGDRLTVALARPTRMRLPLSPSPACCSTSSRRGPSLCAACVPATLPTSRLAT